MALYMLQTSYSAQAWAAMIKHPHNRLEAVQPVIERLGGRLLDGWLAFGDHDLVLICELPDAISAAALSMAVAGGGALKSVKTTPLLAFQDGIEALRAAANLQYAPPPSEIPYFGA